MMRDHTQSNQQPDQARTGGRAVADLLASRIAPHHVDSFQLALRSVVRCFDDHLTRRGTCPHDHPRADRVVQGDTLVIFSDADPRLGCAASQLLIPAIFSAHAVVNDDQKRAQAMSTAERLSRSIAASDRVSVSSNIRMGRLFAKLTALLLDDAELERLSAMTGCVPIVAIVGDTRSTGPTSGQIHHVLTELPGSWLGTAPSTGRA